MATKSIQKFIFSVFSILFVLVALTSCGDIPSSSDDQGSVSHDGANLSIDFPVHKSLAALAIVGLQAQATIDGGDPYPLDVDPVTNQISGNITGVSQGTHDLEITYFKTTPCGDVDLCTYSTQVTVYSGQPAYVTILDTDLDRNLDDDQDGYTNLAEARIGTCPLDDLDVPAGESPYVLCRNGSTGIVSSASYNLTACVGASVAGTADSANYKIIVSFTGYE